jgi:hypothetical protein
LGKLLSEKPPFLEGMTRALGGIWCPLRGIRCKEMGENIFLFTFLQASGKRKALNVGPWTFNKELMVMQDFDPTKALEEYNLIQFQYGFMCLSCLWVRWRDQLENR